MPYLMGSLLVTGIYVTLISIRNGRIVKFPQLIRRFAMAVIGVLVGASVTSEVLQIFPSLWISILAMALFVIITQGFGYLFFRYIGKYDIPTAYYSAMPGGLIEAVTIGEQAGGDVRILTVQHFSRIVIIVLVVPLGFYFWSGETVGSAAGQNFSTAVTGLHHFILIILLAITGLYFGKIARLPASHLMGPLILSSAAHAAGLVAITSPDWLLNLAQLIVGTGLGVMFSGVTGKMLIRAFGLGIIAVVSALLLGLGFSIVLADLVSIGIETLVISFAIGGITEMGLIALSLGVSPLIVAVHHLFRIIFTVVLAQYILGRIQKKD